MKCQWQRIENFWTKIYYFDWSWNFLILNWERIWSLMLDRFKKINFTSENINICIILKDEKEKINIIRPWKTKKKNNKS